MKNFNLAINHKKLENLKPILLKWYNIHRTFADRFSKDCLYWYNERANISILAGAAWKCKEFCMEEYSSTKKHSKKLLKTGRNDLWFTCKEVEYHVEAKQINLLITSRSRMGKINKALKKARKDAVKVQRDDDGQKPVGQKLGIVFIVPYLAVKNSANVDDHIKTFVNELKQEKFGIMACSFPKTYRKLVGSGVLKKYIFPGVVMVGQVPKR